MVSKTGIGIGNGIPFGNIASGRGKPYLSPEVKEALKAVVIAYGKSNNDADRSIVKNLVNPDNPFVISNAAYIEGSGYADKGSPYYGALVTDGVDDLITSTKTVQEMGITDEVTVVSMIHQINLPTRKSFNNIRNSTSVCCRNTLNNDNDPINKTGIYGWSLSDVKAGTGRTLISILGDKNDYTIDTSNKLADNMFFSVEGYKDGNAIAEISQIAWYWTIIANKVLTTDQINQVIAYYNLDRTLNPDILCNTIK